MVPLRRTALLIGLITALGCGQDKQEVAKRTSVGPPTGASVDAGAAENTATEPDAAPVLKIEAFDQDGKKERAALAAIGAVPVWTAVIERPKYLARRHRAGAVWGRVGPERDGYRWLIDETDGSGCLGIRVAFAPELPVAEGDRLLVLGAWIVDAKKRWVWKPARIARLKKPTKLKKFESALGHEIEVITKKPRGAMRISERTGPGHITFEIRSKPVRLGDGYRIADTSFWRTEARLILPGEREPYGAQEMLAPDERWTLERNVRYTVRVRQVRRWGKRENRIVRALTAPRIIQSKKYLRWRRKQLAKLRENAKKQKQRKKGDKARNKKKKR